MKNVFLRCEDSKGERLPDGVYEFRKFGPEGFTITIMVPENEHASQFLRDIEQIMHWVGDRPIGDVGKGLRLVSDMEAYFTTWRNGPKLVPATEEHT